MKEQDINDMLSNMQIPEIENMNVQQGLKIPPFSYRTSSRAGFWLLSLPLVVAITVFLKSALHIQSNYISLVHKLFAAIDNNVILTYLIPLIFIGLPLAAMIINLLAICHFHKNNKAKELIITIKYRPLNIAILFISLIILIFFLLPDNLSF